jgi:hypothetical protein
VEEQAKAANAITKRYAHRRDFSEFQLKILDQIDMKSVVYAIRPSAMEFGNLAYMALHGHEEFRDKFVHKHMRMIAAFKIQHFWNEPKDDVSKYEGGSVRDALTFC